MSCSRQYLPYILHALDSHDPKLGIRNRLIGNRQDTWKGQNLLAAYGHHPNEIVLVTSKTKNIYNVMEFEYLQKQMNKF